MSFKENKEKVFKFLGDVLFNVVLPIGAMAVKAKNPDKAALVDVGVAAIKELKDNKELDLSQVFEQTAFVLSKEEKKIQDKLEEQRKQREERERVNNVIEMTNVDRIVGIKSLENTLLESASDGFLRTKYFTKEDIVDAPVDMEIKTRDPRDIRCDVGFNFKEGDFGFFPVIIDSFNCLMHGGHGCKGGMPSNGTMTRNTGLTGQSGKDYEIDLDTVKYYFLVRTNFEGNPRGILGRSQILEYKK